MRVYSFVHKISEMPAISVNWIVGNITMAENMRKECHDEVGSM